MEEGYEFNKFKDYLKIISMSANESEPLDELVGMMASFVMASGYQIESVIDCFAAWAEENSDIRKCVDCHRMLREVELEEHELKPGGTI